MLMLRRMMRMCMVRSVMVPDDDRDFTDDEYDDEAEENADD